MKIFKGFGEEFIKHDMLQEKIENILHAGGYLLGISAIDYARGDESGTNIDNPAGEGRFEIKYFFVYDGIKSVSIGCDKKFPSIARFCPSAKLYEREISDMFGLIPTNHPDFKPLMLFPENWDPKINPLKKDYDPGNRPEFKKYGDYAYKKVYGEGIFEVPVGPVHAGIIEPGHFRFSMRGEPVLQLEIRHFWKHRGIEKLCEGKNPAEVLKIVSRISGDNCVNVSIAYLEAVERILGIELTRGSKIIRVLLAEMERLWNHVRDVAFIFMDMAYNLHAQGLFTLQEDILRLNKRIFSHRYLFDSLCIGGVSGRIKISPTDAGIISSLLDNVRNKITSTWDIILNKPSVADRIEFTGKINHKTADELSLCGVCARASGLRRDTRVEIPYLLYGEEIKVHTTILSEGDIMARTRLRVREILESAVIIKGLLKELPEAVESLPVRDTVPADIAMGSEGKAGGFAVGNAETARGNAFFYVRTDGKGNIFRLKYIDPSFRNWPAIQYGILGDIIADFPLVNKSMNLSYSGNDL